MSESFDIAVVGSGAAGIAAAVSAARAGRKTLLLDERPSAGGTGGFSGLTTLCGLFDDAGNFLNDGFPREFAERISEVAPLRMGKVWVLQYRPEKFREAAANYLNEANVQTRLNTSVTCAALEGKRIVSLNSIKIGAVIDCTGTAEVARAIGAECLQTDNTTQAPAVIFPLRNVCRELNTPAAVAQVLLPLARAGFAPLNFQTDVGVQASACSPDKLKLGLQQTSHALNVKFSGKPEDVPELIRFLQTNIPGFENCSTPLKTFTVTKRAGRMILGPYLLTGEDVLNGQKFPDAAARCAWPIEQWNANGIARFKYLTPGTHYEIPARCLRSANIENLFMAGKTISADVDAIASARVMGCCLATGEAAGKLAAKCLC